MFNNDCCTVHGLDWDWFGGLWPEQGPKGAKKGCFHIFWCRVFVIPFRLIFFLLCSSRQELPVFEIQLIKKGNNLNFATLLFLSNFVNFFLMLVSMSWTGKSQQILPKSTFFFSNNGQKIPFFLAYRILIFHPILLGFFYWIHLKESFWLNFSGFSLSFTFLEIQWGPKRAKTQNFEFLFCVRFQWFFSLDFLWKSLPAFFDQIWPISVSEIKGAKGGWKGTEPKMAYRILIYSPISWEIFSLNSY